MAITIFPTTNDVGGNLTGRKIGEGIMQKYIKGLTPYKNHVISGGAPSDGGGFVCDIAAGSAIVNGKYVEWDATNVTLPPSTVGRVYLTLQRGAGLVTGIEPETVANSGAIPDDSLLLAIWATSATDILLVADERIYAQGIIAGQYTGDGSNTQFITVAGAVTPTLVIASGNGASNDPQIIGCSGISMWANRDFNSVGVPNDKFPAFSVRDRSADVKTVLPQTLVGSKAWNPGVLIGKDDVEQTTVTVTGAEVGDAVWPWFDQQANLGSSVDISAAVTSADTVTVTLRNYETGNVDFPNGQLRVFVHKPLVNLPEPDAHFTNDPNAWHAPYIVSGGFRVGHDMSGQSDPTLNMFGERYRYVAFM